MQSAVNQIKIELHILYMEEHKKRWMAVSLGYVTSHIPNCIKRITNCLLYILTFISFCIYFSVEIDTFKKKKCIVCNTFGKIGYIFKKATSIVFFKNHFLIF